MTYVLYDSLYNWFVTPENLTTEDLSKAMQFKSRAEAVKWPYYQDGLDEVVDLESARLLVQLGDL